MLEVYTVKEMNEMFRYVLMVVMGIAVVLGMAIFSFTAWMEGDDMK